MLNCFVIILDSVYQIIEGIDGFSLHDNIGTVEYRQSWINLEVSYILVFLREVYEEVKPYILCCWRAISNFALFTVQYSILNQQICISNDQWIFEGGVCYIKDLYSLLIWDTHIGNGLGRIILCDHGVGVIIQFFWKWWLNMNCIGDLVVQVLWYV